MVLPFDLVSLSLKVAITPGSNLPSGFFLRTHWNPSEKVKRYVGLLYPVVN